jgi:hypothetical protein
LVAEQQKTYQIRTTASNSKDALIAIYGRTIHQTKQFEVLSNDIIFQTHALPVIQILSDPCDLTKYLFRQKTQELLFATKELLETQHNLDHATDDPFERYNALYQLPQTKEQEKIEAFKKQKDDLKKKMKDFFKVLLDYIEAHSLKTDAFFKTLCDDIYISIKSFDTQHGLMYTAARQTSQGRQQTYTCRPTQDLDINQLPLLPPALTRGYTLGGPRSTPRCTAVAKDNLDLELGSELEYELSQEDTSGYASLGVMKMMREVSYQPPTPIEDKNKDLNSITQTIDLSKHH